VIGFLNVFKPAGPTSHDIVAGARRRLPRGVKVGHCGTLDPFAEGVLVLCVGAATRLAAYVQRQPKRYLAQVTLGASSTTDDPTGTITPTPPGAPGRAPPSEEQARACLAAFVGEIRQAPPAHSAVHVEGRRAYQLARRGQDVDLAPRPVSVYGIDVLRYEYPLLELDVRCGGGTYIRALARDIGVALGTAAYCSRLTRTEVGVFRAADAVRPDDLDPTRDLLSPLAALEGMERLTLEEADCARVAMGRSVDLPLARAVSGTGGAAPQSCGEVALLNEKGELLAIADIDAREGLLRPRIVLWAR
jgi:tRNA pseudouridine55 synthase